MKVILIYGSANDMPFMEPAREYLMAEGVEFVEEVLSPTLSMGDVVVMDNLTSHKVIWIREVIENGGSRFVYLPP